MHNTVTFFLISSALIWNVCTGIKNVRSPTLDQMHYSERKKETKVITENSFLNIFPVFSSLHINSMIITQGRYTLHIATTILIFHNHLNQKFFGIWFLLIHIQIFYQMGSEKEGKKEKEVKPEDRLSEAKKSSHCPKCTYCLLNTLHNNNSLEAAISTS